MCLPHNVSRQPTRESERNLDVINHNIIRLRAKFRFDLLVGCWEQWVHRSSILHAHPRTDFVEMTRMPILVSWREHVRFIPDLKSQLQLITTFPLFITLNLIFNAKSTCDRSELNSALNAEFSGCGKKLRTKYAKQEWDTQTDFFTFPVLYYILQKAAVMKGRSLRVIPRDSSVGRAVDCSGSYGYPSVTGSIPVRETLFWSNNNDASICQVTVFYSFMYTSVCTQKWHQ